jgi:hypothetical protein
MVHRPVKFAAYRNRYALDGRNQANYTVLAPCKGTIYIEAFGFNVRVGALRPEPP